MAEDTTAEGIAVEVSTEEDMAEVMRVVATGEVVTAVVVGLSINNLIRAATSYAVARGFSSRALTDIVQIGAATSLPTEMNSTEDDAS